ncbi:MAG: hypothetical protein ABWY07_00830, partial [Burkholderiales bacterium]
MQAFDNEFINYHEQDPASMLKRALITLAATSAFIAVAVADTRWRDVLDTPAVKSPLAVRALV